MPERGLREVGSQEYPEVAPQTDIPTAVSLPYQKDFDGCV